MYENTPRAYTADNKTLRLSISKGAGITILTLKCIEYSEPDQVGESIVEVDWDLKKRNVN